MSTHTPGPWTLTTVPTQVGICHKIGPFPDTRGNGKPMHACVYVDGVYRAEHEPALLANARLIAAAPELLAALKRAASWIKSEAEGNDEMPLAFVIAESAIRKAEGK